MNTEQFFCAKKDIILFTKPVEIEGHAGDLKKLSEMAYFGLVL